MKGPFAKGWLVGKIMIKQYYGAPLLIPGLGRVRDGPGSIIQQEEVRVGIVVICGGSSKDSVTQQPGSCE